MIPAKETDRATPNAMGVRFKEYKVKRKETLYTLAKENGIRVEDIKKYNPYLYDEQLGENDMIRIPIFENEARDFNASVQTSTFRNIAHVVMPKETKYGISKRYNMRVEELDSLNPLIKELRPGQVLKVINHLSKTEPSTLVEEDFTYYEVQPKETIYSLTRALGISKDSLELFNPVLKELGLQAGMELKIPRRESSSDLETLSSEKLNLQQYLSNRSTKNISVLLPFNIYKVNEEDKSENKALLKSDEILGISLDLYSGIKTAVDSVQKMGIPVQIQVYDTEGSTRGISKILQGNNLRHSQVIIGPLLAPNIRYLANELKRSNTAIFSPLVNEELQGSDKIFQTRPAAALKEELLISYLDSLSTQKNMVMLYDQKGASFAQRIQHKFPSVRRITQADTDYLQKSDITPYLEKGRPNWVLMATEDYGLISNAISALNAVRSEYDIRVLTADKNSIYDEEVPEEYLSNLKFTYASIDKSDVSFENDLFVKNYRRQYGITPNAYATRGFDIAFDALLRASSSTDIFRSLSRYKGYTEYVESRFNYTKKSKEGYTNKAVFLIQYDDDLTLKVLN